MPVGTEPMAVEHSSIDAVMVILLSLFEKRVHFTSAGQRKSHRTPGREAPSMSHGHRYRTILRLVPLE
jgi:hypothetical protein